ncbi:MAG: bifunctional phosphopantothenoylcysteine decarboxylase/phosphopantothenate--cysteine ligase CoaBC [Xanthobacteraceae bacterium]|nr:bifunctional phosphopantothenoylcysteine decarboxylase/phosphopantothenate--cysteine ligase CoaBC [Xanthobacteraceae bacterium]MCW5677574.1 bifunctional phosphopantothenoylcysteine decarboxylase/phosphopantothenate--cysteine ligase CoaBC [Xanthobacteraceae bacterium]
MPLQGKKILLVIAGGIAAYKSLDLIRRLRERGAKVRVIMTRAAQEFVTPLAVGAVAGERPFTELFDLFAEFDVGHIRLAREPDLIIVAPATADLMAKMVQGRADDLASTVLLATERRILLSPAMNPAMWNNAATRRNVERLQADGIAFIGPEAGEMAESGERGVGRMSEPLVIVAAAEKNLFDLPARDALLGKKILVTSGPTREPIDPVRYISNHSSGKQGHALARMAVQAGAEVVLVSGPVNLPDPSGVKTIHVETAQEMLNASENALPADAAIFAAAVADWRVTQEAAQKMKKQEGKLPSLSFAENPDILATISRHSNLRPRLVIGFAAETEKLIDNARAKLLKKGCDWIVANDVSTGTATFGGASNEVHIVTANGVESWPMQSKDAVAAGLVKKIAATLGGAQ